MSEGQVETVPRRHDGLQIEERKSVARWHWTAERIAWCGFVLLVAAAMAGATGSGGSLSRHRAATAAATFDLPAISRWQAAESLTIAFDAPQHAHQVVLGPALLDLFAVENIVPKPDSESFGARGLTLAVTAPEGRLVLSLRARRTGLARYHVTADGAAVAGRTLVLP